MKKPASDIIPLMEIGTEATINIDLKMEEEIHDTKVQNSDLSKIQIQAKFRSKHTEFRIQI